MIRYIKKTRQAGSDKFNRTCLLCLYEPELEAMDTKPGRLFKADKFPAKFEISPSLRYQAIPGLDFKTRAGSSGNIV
ncbi:MAG: hypothetical protein K9N06_07660 [Candidatus Cloacimonetes bacterium]|nr:hypothetical protein [Candidatus Cloacimonadota bacterium]